MKKKLIVILLSISLLVTMMPQFAFAGDIGQTSENKTTEEKRSDDEKDYLSFTAVGSNMKVGLKKLSWASYGLKDITIEYSQDREEWHSYKTETDLDKTIEIEQNETMYFRLASDSPITGQSRSIYWFFTMDGDGTIEADGNVMSMVDPTLSTSKIVPEYAFTYLFYKCEKMTKAPKLPATSLSTGCYAHMFSYCKGLKTAPALPATTMESYCYEEMFDGCENLVNPPVLNGVQMAYRCYYGMFDECKALVNPPAMPSTKLAEECYYRTFYNCENLSHPPELPATKLAKGCYNLMFENCSKLLEVPELPATTVAESCYTGMFRGCSSITEAPILPATKLAKNCYNNMFHNCTNLQKAPMLAATELVDSCYFAMFAGCKSLTSISVKFSNWNDDGHSTMDWVMDANVKGTFTCPGNLDTLMRDQSHVPQGWIIKHYPAPVVPQVKDLYVKATNSKTCLLTWDKVKGSNVQYQIFRGTKSTGDWGDPIATVKETSYKDLKVIPGTVYYYKVRATMVRDGVRGYGKLSNMDYGYPRLNPIQGFGAKALTSVSTQVSWKKGLDNDTEYWIYRGYKPTGDWGNVYAKVTNGKTVFTEKYPKVKPDKKYYYMVREAVKAYNGKYYFGPYTKVDYAYPRVAVPKNFKAWSPGKICKLSWTKVPESGVKYFIYRGTKPTGDWGNAIAVTTKSGYTDRKVKRGRKYYYMIRAMKTVGGKNYFSDYTRIDYAYPR